MPKAVTNEEVEDVLSSIRRLVSEDKRPLAGLSNTPKRVAEEPVPDRLVLTPALRVADTPAAPAGDRPLDLGSVARETWTPSETDSDVADEATAAQAQSGAIDALVQDALETQDLTDDETGLTDGDYSDEGYWEDGADEVDPQDEAVGEVAPTDARPALKQVAAEYGDATLGLDPLEDCDRDKESDADTGHWKIDPALDKYLISRSSYLGFEEVDEIEFVDRAAKTPEAVEQEPQDASILKADVPLKAKIAALGAAIGKSPDEWEPDGDEPSALSAHKTPSMAWEDDLELDARGAPLRSAPVEDIDHAEETAEGAPETEPVAAAFVGDDQLMDEEALRDLVAEIVRAELQGALGERITRNVRKLVRREIHRALTAQELE